MVLAYSPRAPGSLASSSPRALPPRARDAGKSVGAQKAWRFWSESDPSVHQATYQFADRAALDRGTRPENMTRLVADFDKAWPHIKRSREIMTLAQDWGA